MKTLKKTLCLVLAVVLALGVMVLPAYADKKTYDNFKDKDTIDVKYEEAVGTLTGLGTINGRDSNVEADKNITRAEAVTMLVRALLGKAESTLPKKGSQFTDVPATHYASQYVAYAVNQGITAGKSSTEFKPDDLVTGYELARMVLVAAGIKTDFDPSYWQTQTGPTASKAGLLVGLENIKDLNKTLSRQEAAQLIWNMVKYVPDTVILDVVEVTGTTGKTTYQVTYPVESIGGSVYNLVAMYNTDGTYDGGTWDDAYGRPSVQWSNGKTGEIYYQGVCGGITSFYVDHAALTLKDVKDALNRTDGITAFVYRNGWKNTPALTIVASTPDNTKLTDGTNDRGALVTIFSAPWGGVTYWVYISYTYAAYNHVKTADGVNATANPNNTGYLNGTVTLGIPMGDKEIATFGLTQYHGWRAVNVKVASGTKVQITARNNNSTDPYFRLNGGDTKYVSAKGILVKLDGTVEKLDWATNVKVSAQWYNVVYDARGFVLALVETVEPPTPAEKIKYDGFGYVLEYSSKPAVTGNDDMTWDKDQPAQVKALMVDLKTGSVGIYTVGITKDNLHALGIDGKANMEFTINNTDKVLSSIEDTVLHGFVAYKQLPDGTWGMTEIDKLAGIGSDDQGYAVVTDFAVDELVPGRVDVTPTATHYADNNSEIVILDTHTVTDDKSRVAAYHVNRQVGYKNLKNVVTEKAPTQKDSVNATIGRYALFVYDTATNMVKTAYIFGAQRANPATVTYDYYVLMGRSESVLNKGTEFTLMHDGVIGTYPCDQVVEVYLDEDDAMDALLRHPVVFVTFKDGKITKIEEVTDAKYFLELPSVNGYLVGEYIADGDVAPEIGGVAGDPIRLDPDCVVVSAKTGDVVTNTNLVGKKVKVYYADETMKTVSLIVVQDN